LWRFPDRDDLQNLAQARVVFELAWANDGAGKTEVQNSDVAAAIKSAARLLSAVEPVIRYQRERFHGSPAAASGTPRHDLGLQMKEDAVHRLLEVWAGGEACASLGFQAARVLDRLDPVIESVANVLCAACKVWSTRHASRLMREALSLMGGIGVTEDCPGLLGVKWIDSLKESFGNGSHETARRRLGVAMTDELFLTQFREWMRDLRALAAVHSGIGTTALAVAMEVWLWTLDRLQDPDIRLRLADELCGILASRSQILDVIELLRTRPGSVAATFLSGLCHVQALNVTGDVGRACAGLVHGCGDSSAGLAFAEMQVLLDQAVVGSFAVKDRALQALIRVKIPAARVPGLPAPHCA
jgi:hypothetical protein